MAHDKYYAICENKCLVDITHLEHKKGQYVGNADATERRIEVQGKGNMLLITSARGVAIVTAYGAFCKAASDTTITGLSFSDVMFIPDDNVLRTKTTNPFVNGRGDVYTWERI